MATGQSIQLQSPVANHFESFIFGNALHALAIAREQIDPIMPDQCAAIDALGLSPQDQIVRFMPLVLDHCPDTPVVHEGSAEGQHLVICGAGPSLADHAEEYCRTADQLWGCNSALTWLVAHGYPVTHGFAVDQTPDMLTEWHSAPDVEYLVASTCHVHLIDYLRGTGRRVRFFHNYVGIRKPHVEWPDAHGVLKRSEYEDWLYALLYPGTVRAGSGLNAVTRAIDVALCMGFATITVLGADCSLKVTSPRPDGACVGSPEHLAWLRESVIMHADGGHALASGATMVTLEGEIDGRLWTSKPDMMISAVFLAQMEKKLKGKLRLIGDTLPNAIKGKPASFLNRLPSLVGANGKRIQLV